MTTEDDKFIVKIGDLGLSKFGEYYYGASEAPFPIRWSAPEVLKRRKFSHKSDVWAFGISNNFWGERSNTSSIMGTLQQWRFAIFQADHARRRRLCGEWGKTGKA